jgi:ABC-type antimicrobial peptide transport system permease subunit
MSIGSRKLPLMVVFGAVIAILLVAVANMAALTSVRGARRRAEFSIRAALGAGRRHIVRLILAESAVLAVAGGVAGLLVADGILSAIVPLIPDTLPRADDALGSTGVSSSSSPSRSPGSRLCSLASCRRERRAEKIRTVR